MNNFKECKLYKKPERFATAFTYFFNTATDSSLKLETSKMMVSYLEFTVAVNT